MDGGRHPRRPDEPPLPPNYPYVQGMHPQAGQQQRHPSVQQPPQQHQLQHQGQQPQQQQRRSVWNQGGSIDSRYQQTAPLNTSTAAMGQRDLGSSAAYSDPYYQGSAGGSYATSSNIPQGSMGYAQSSAGYGQQDARQASSYSAGGYGQHPAAGIMYNVPQAASTAHNPQVYDASQQYPRQSASSLNLMNPDVSYYQSGPTGVSSAATTLQAQAQPPPSSASQAGGYQQPGHLQSYADIAMNMTPQTSTTAAMGSIEEQQQAVPVEEDPSETFAHYDSVLREAFREIRDGDLANASETLLTASSLLRDGVSRFGLVADDSRARADRIGVWRDFNNAWLTLLQRQKDMVESHQQLGQAQSILTLEALKNLGKQLVDLADVLERHGLVDYEMGLWEERIVDILEECCDLYEQANANTSSSS
ncbi:hypothetical protein GE09DRAFT_157366 [Coniochaeta sp. 2T2.1]|nr:hypothetical protein GE09DRAFT_157366 [Coniochaeta sp. 2T2.1]